MKTLQQIKEEIEINGFVSLGGVYICKGDYMKHVLSNDVYEEQDVDSQYVIDTTYDFYVHVIEAEEGDRITGYESVEECIEAIDYKVEEV
jgi:hypothetical protein